MRTEAEEWWQIADASISHNMSRHVAARQQRAAALSAPSASRDIDMPRSDGVLRARAVDEEMRRMTR